MFQNLKVDTVYYKTNTDFEMEFNLCGCCRMRLLTDKVADKKALVHSLARAVSRSRVIIIVGNLFGDEGIIKIVAGAIGGELSAADNNTYGISSDTEINIINGSIPLVTPEGYFGGCIIEKGPQTMIMLTESKNVRKTVMKNLIHPYMEELCAFDLKEKANATLETQGAGAVAQAVGEVAIASAEAAEEVSKGALEVGAEGVTEVAAEIGTEILATDETEETAEQEPEEEMDFVLQEEETPLAEVVEENSGEEYELISEEEDEETEENQEEIELLTDDEGYEEIEMEHSDSDEFELFDETDEIGGSEFLYDENSISLGEIRRRNAEYYNDEEDVGDIVTEDEDFERGKVKGGLGIPILITSILLLILIAVLSYCIFYVPSTKGSTASEYVKEIFTTLFG